MSNEVNTPLAQSSEQAIGLAPSTCWAPSSARTLHVLFWITFLGEYVERCVNIASPLVSNQPDPSIQHAADCRVVEAWRDAVNAPSGTEYYILGVLPNDEAHPARPAGHNRNL